MVRKVLSVTVTAYNRPRYLEQTLSALAKCDGVRDCTVTVFFDPCEETQEQIDIATAHVFDCMPWLERQGCNLAIGKAIEYGFNQGKNDFHVHLEDDTVPTRDCLRWFAWARDNYRDDPAVMNVSGYQRISNGRPGEAGLRRWFTPWGWGTWHDRWAGLARGWAGAEPSWDVIVNHVLRAGRYEAFPTVSRIQNIGAERGTHVPSVEWHEANHRVPVTADDLLSDGHPFANWTQARVDQHADHA